jgi:hypothetical protein
VKAAAVSLLPAVSSASSETSQMRRSDSFEVAASGVTISFSFASCRLRNAFGFLFIARSETIEDQHQPFQNATTAMHIPSDVGFGAANLRLPQSNEGLL